VIRDYHAISHGDRNATSDRATGLKYARTGLSPTPYRTLDGVKALRTDLLVNHVEDRIQALSAHKGLRIRGDDRPSDAAIFQRPA